MSRYDHDPHELFHILSEAIRLRILCLLRVRELCVCDIVEILDYPQPTISRHLMILRQAGLINLRRFKRWTFYSLRPSDDPLCAVVPELLDIARKRSPQLKEDAATLRSKTRPACPTIVQL